MADSNPPRPRLGDLLLAAGAIDEAQLQAALGEQKKWGRRLGATLVEMGLVEEMAMIRALAAQLELPVVELEGKRVNDEVIALVPADVAQKDRCLPLLVRERGEISVLYLCTADPTNLDAIDELAFRLEMQIQPVLAAPSQIDEAIARHYEEPVGPEIDAFDLSAPNHDEAYEDTSLGLAEEPEFIGIDCPPDAKAPLVFEPGSPAPDGEFSNDTMLRAIAQLLVERGIFTRDELIERLTAVAASRGGTG